MAAQPAVAGVQRGQRDAGHRRRQRERQIDQRIDETLAGEGIADQHPGHDQAEEGVDQRSQQRRAEGDAKGRQRALAEGDVDDLPEAEFDALRTMPPSGSRMSSDR